MAAGSLATGIEVSCAIAFLLTITAEILDASDGGLGWQLHFFRQASSGQPKVLASILWMALFGLTLNTRVSALRRRMLFWEDGGRSELSAPALPWLASRFSTLEKGLLERITDSRLREAITSDDVTSTLRSAFSPNALEFRATYNLREPYLFPPELAWLGVKQGELVQRDLEVRVESDRETPQPIFFARSWPALDQFSSDIRRKLSDGKLSLGEIVPSSSSEHNFQANSYRVVTIEGLSRFPSDEASPQLVERTRSLAGRGKVVAILKEYVSLD